MDRRRRLGEISGEFTGCLVMMVIGLGAEVAVPAGGGVAVLLGWGVGVTCAFLVSARLSGPHLNPAITVGLAVCSRFPWRAVPRYVLAQLAGGFVAALVVGLADGELLRRVDPDLSVTGRIGPPAAIWAELVATALLVLVMCALLTPATNPSPTRLTPTLVGWLVVVVGMGWGAASGFAVNPARDLGLRVLSLLTGQHDAPHVWLAVLAPIFGGVLGAVLFRVLVEQFLPAPDAPDAPVTPDSPERLDRRDGAADAPLFVYGSLQFDDVLRTLLDRVPEHSPAEVYGWRAAAQLDVEDPGLVPAHPLTKVSGVVLDGLEHADWDVLDAFEDPNSTLTLLTLADGRQAWTYTGAESGTVLDSDWSVGQFADHHLPGYVQRCAVWRARYAPDAETTRSRRRQCRAAHRGVRLPVRGPRPAGKRQFTALRAGPSADPVDPDRAEST
jgi:glycerol uptake facilitator protein